MTDKNEARKSYKHYLRINYDDFEFDDEESLKPEMLVLEIMPSKSESNRISISISVCDEEKIE